MKRRRFVKALAAVPATPALLAQQPPAPPPGVPAEPAPGVPLNPAQPVQPPTRPVVEATKALEITLPDAAAEPVPHFFTPQQFAALQKLSGVLMPGVGKIPGANQAKAAEFLDFLIGRSPADRQQLYRTGLDALNSQSNKRFKKSFADLDSTQTDTMLASLREPWTFDLPNDPLARFLRAAKQDVRIATVNSREYSAASSAGGNRRFGNSGLYWYSLD